jgi:hypothetical protein
MDVGCWGCARLPLDYGGLFFGETERPVDEIRTELELNTALIVRNSFLDHQELERLLGGPLSAADNLVVVDGD